ncbi:hypothetical protein [Streptomyces liangshanensis]|uniref:hypothetical protein n=1 Tax=Streptomyces liangshanensis TaxID=2717324 RepID=UPI0036DC1B27
MTSDGDAKLGILVREHVTDNARRRSTGLSALIVGVLFTAIGIPVVIAYADGTNSSGPPFLPGVLLGIGLAGLGFGVLGLVRAARSRGEAFLVHERGLVRRRSGRETVIRWTDIASVTETGKDSGPARYMGNDVQCRLRLKSGGSMRFSGYVTSAGQLAATVARAVQDGQHPEPAPQKSRWEV